MQSKQKLINTENLNPLMGAILNQAVIVAANYTARLSDYKNQKREQLNRIAAHIESGDYLQAAILSQILSEQLRELLNDKEEERREDEGEYEFERERGN